MKISNIIKIIIYIFLIIPLSGCGTIISKVLFKDWEIEAMDRQTEELFLSPVEDTSTYDYRDYKYVSYADGEKPYIISAPEDFTCETPLSLSSQFCKSSLLYTRYLVFPTFIFETVALQITPDKDEKIFIVGEESYQNQKQNLAFQAFVDMLKKPNIKIIKAIPILFEKGHLENGDANYQHMGYYVYLDSNNSFKKLTKFYTYVTK
jgi:hypothetical protein